VADTQQQRDNIASCAPPMPESPEGLDQLTFCRAPDKLRRPPAHPPNGIRRAGNDLLHAAVSQQCRQQAHDLPVIIAPIAEQDFQRVRGNILRSIVPIIKPIEKEPEGRGFGNPHLHGSTIAHSCLFSKACKPMSRLEEVNEKG